MARASSAPASFVNIMGGHATIGTGVPKGRWRMSLSLGDFLLGTKLGEGLTGRVHYAQLKVRGLECALKIMRKAKLVELGEEHHVCSELEALGRINSPFVTALLGCFQDVHAVYLAIEYMRGPDLFAYMCVASRVAHCS
jgi:serine/threonine protein kinase